MTSATIRAVIFDCDGVLVNSEALAVRGERAALEALGLYYSPEDYVRRFTGLHDAAFFEALRADYAKAKSAPPPTDFNEQVLAGRRREMHALAAIDGADEALKTARAQFGEIAVASSARAAFLDRKLRATGLYDFAAPHIYSADLVKRGKPAPDIFLYAANAIGVDPKHCLALEDSENGVKSAAAAGMTVWGFTGGGHCYAGHGERLMDAGAARVVDDFAAFIDSLRQDASIAE